MKVKTTHFTNVLSVESGTIYQIPDGTCGTVVATNGVLEPPKLLIRFDTVIDELANEPVYGWVLESVTTTTND